jgi:hypothetical protein
MYKLPGQPVQLLWTGGWDSTFRLLHLTIGEGKIVQPFYLIDVQRLSTGQEIRTMRQIKDRLFAEHPQTKHLILPTIYTEVYDIQENITISEAFRRVRLQNYMGGQYAWLARWCAEQKIEDIELCIHRDDRAHEVIEQSDERIHPLSRDLNHQPVPGEHRKDLLLDAERSCAEALLPCYAHVDGWIAEERLNQRCIARFRRYRCACRHCIAPSDQVVTQSLASISQV